MIKKLAEIGSKKLLRLFKPEIKNAQKDLTKTLMPVLLADTPEDMKSRLRDVVNTYPVLSEFLCQKFELTQLLLHILRGEIANADQLLEEDPALLYCKGRIIDTHGRIFLG